MENIHETGELPKVLIEGTMIALKKKIKNPQNAASSHIRQR
jgi:hypothetical protein